MEEKDFKSVARSKHIGRNIRAFRHARGFSQKEFAKLLKVQQQKVSDWERSKDVDDETLEKIGIVLDVSPEILKNFDDQCSFTIIENNTVTIDSNADSNVMFGNDNISNYTKTDKTLVEALQKVISQNEDVIQLLKEKSKKDDDKIVDLENKLQHIQELYKQAKSQ